MICKKKKKILIGFDSLSAVVVVVSGNIRPCLAYTKISLKFTITSLLRKDSDNGQNISAYKMLGRSVTTRHREPPINS